MPSLSLATVTVPPLLVLAVLYVVLGGIYYAVNGTDLPTGAGSGLAEDREFARLCWLAGVLTVALLLWPAAPFLRAARRVRERRAATAGPVERWISTSAKDGIAPAGGLPPSPVTAATNRTVSSDPVFPDVKGAARQLEECCSQGRLVEAVISASNLVVETSALYGAGHPVALDAMEQLAVVAHRVGDHARAVRLYTEVAEHRAWYFGPTDAGALRALHRGYRAWCAAPDPVAVSTGWLVLPLLRQLAGHTSPATVAGELRMHALGVSRVS